MNLSPESHETYISITPSSSKFFQRQEEHINVVAMVTSVPDVSVVADAAVPDVGVFNAVVAGPSLTLRLQAFLLVRHS